MAARGLLGQAISAPSSVIRPVAAGSIPQMERMNVVRPDPTSPHNPTISPWRTVMSRPCRTFGNDTSCACSTVSPSGRRFLWITGGPQHAPATPGSDVEALGAHYISVTPMRPDITCRVETGRLAAVLDEG